MPRIFLSHSSKDRQLADDLAELFRLHYVETWYSNRDILAGPWEPEIYKGLDLCDSFLVVLSEDAVHSEWVRKEVELAMQDPRYIERGRIVPVLARPCAWRTIRLTWPQRRCRHDILLAAAITAVRVSRPLAGGSGEADVCDSAQFGSLFRLIGDRAFQRDDVDVIPRLDARFVRCVPVVA